MDDHKTARRITRRRMAWAAFCALIGSIIGTYVAVFSGLADELAKVQGVVISGHTALGGLVGWYMKLGSDENRHTND